MSFMMIVTQALHFETEEEMKLGVRAYLKADPHVNEEMLGHLINKGSFEALMGSAALSHMKKKGVPATEIAFGITLTEDAPNGKYREVPLGAPPPAEPVDPPK